MLSGAWAKKDAPLFVQTARGLPLTCARSRDTLNLLYLSPAKVPTKSHVWAMKPPNASGTGVGGFAIIDRQRFTLGLHCGLNALNATSIRICHKAARSAR